MITDALTGLFERDLQRLKTEIELYRVEENIWIVKEGIGNSAGNLCLHLLGNLSHFIGGKLGHTGYVRHREDEFSLKNIPRPYSSQTMAVAISFGSAYEKCWNARGSQIPPMPIAIVSIAKPMTAE